MVIKVSTKQALMNGCKLTCEPGFQHMSDADIISTDTKQIKEKDTEEKRNSVSVTTWNFCALTLCFSTLVNGISNIMILHLHRIFEQS
jgi:hypothetical protein